METFRWPVMRRRYSFGRRAIRGGTGSVAVTADVDTAVTVAAIRGVWGDALRRDAFVAVRKALGEHPAALIVDLCDLIDPHAASVSMWLTVSQVADAMQPPVRVAACLPSGAALAARMHRLGAPNFLPLFDDLGSACRAVARGGPVPDRRRLELPVHPDTPALARNLVTEACAAWGLSKVLYPARLVMSELAGNAIEHARTPISVVVARRDPGLQLMVIDRDPRLPWLLDPPKEPPGSLWDVRGQGLRTVQAAAAAWGALPTGEGKMVWATVRPR